MPNPNVAIHDQIITAARVYAVDFDAGKFKKRLDDIQDAGGNLAQRNECGKTPLFVLASEGCLAPVEWMMRNYGYQDSDVVAGLAFGRHEEQVNEYIRGNLSSQSTWPDRLFVAARKGYELAGNIDAIRRLSELINEQYSVGVLNADDAFSFAQRYANVECRAPDPADIESYAVNGDNEAVNRLQESADSWGQLCDRKNKAAHGYGLCGNMVQVISLLFKRPECQEVNLKMLQRAMHGHYNGGYFDTKPSIRKMIESVPAEYRVDVIDYMLEKSTGDPSLPRDYQRYHIVYHLGDRRSCLIQLKRECTQRLEPKSVSASGLFSVSDSIRNAEHAAPAAKRRSNAK